MTTIKKDILKNKQYHKNQETEKKLILTCEKIS